MNDIENDAKLWEVVSAFNKDKPTEEDFKIVDKVNFFSHCMVVLNEFTEGRANINDFIKMDLENKINTIKSLAIKLFDNVKNGKVSLSQCLEKLIKEYNSNHN